MLREDLEKIIGHFYGDEYDSCCDKLVNKDRKCSCDTEWKVDQIITLIEKAVPLKIEDYDSRWTSEPTDDDCGNEIVGERCYGFNECRDQILKNLGIEA